MKKYFDKIILLLALAVLGAGVGLYYLSGGVKVADKTTEGAMKGGAYQAITPPPAPSPIEDWPSPPPLKPPGDSMSWQYYVFTPPQIWWDTVANIWKVQPPIPPLPFGLELAEIKHTYYRLYFGGAVAAPSGDPKDATLSFTDDELSGTIRMKVGQTNIPHQFRVLDFVLEPRQNKNGLIIRHPIVTIEDMRTNETLKIERGVPIVKPGLDYAVLKTMDPLPVQEWPVKEAGQTLELPGNVKFRVLNVNFDFDNPSVSVEKSYPLKSKGIEIVQVDYEILKLAPPAPPATANPAPATPPAAEEAAPAPSTP